MTAPLAFREGYGVFGTPVMKFTLHYDGPLLSSGNKGKNENKWHIRKDLHPQLVDLWGSHPALKAVEDNRHFPVTGGAVLTQAHHLHPGPVHPPVRARLEEDGSQTLYLLASGEGPGILDLCQSIEKHGAWFRPLVRDSYALHCGLKIHFLRQEPPGRIYQGGDLDGRIKTLLDALAMPQHVEQILETNTKNHPVYCLLEDDAAISGVEIESERLLGNQNNPKEWVKLTIEVDVRVRQATIYNQSFLG
jgi:hypothetical protein